VADIVLAPVVPVPAGTGASLSTACGATPGIPCRLIWDLTHSARAADITSVYLAGPIRLGLRLALVVALAIAVRVAAGRVIRRLASRVASDDGQDKARGVFGERRSQRATALATLLGNAASVAIFIVAGLIVLGDIGLNLAPVLASAGVLGLALGFGAQNLVQDCLAGVFILLEDQYGVGDVIDLAHVTGTVEAVSLRITRIRDVNGVVWHIRNGPIKKAGNETHGWARAVIDVPVPYGVPVAGVRAALQDAAAQMAREARWSQELLEAPEVWGVETVSPDGLLMRVVARTAPTAKHDVSRELRERLMAAVDSERAAMASASTGAAPSPQQADQVPRPRRD
jgi:moderate conductance mechanosensitive channel